MKQTPEQKANDLIKLMVSDRRSTPRAGREDDLRDAYRDRRPAGGGGCMHVAIAIASPFIVGIASLIKHFL